MKNNLADQHSNIAGLFTLSIRLVIGWTYFSAFWRRLILENKLNPEEAGYIGEKFNHFLPNALGIKPVIEYLVLNPDILHTSMVVFTIVEAIVGLLLMLGLFTRLVSIGVFGLAMGILLGSGWLGTTCLDEWQIGVLGIAGGFTLFLTGSGAFSLDNYFRNKNANFTQKKWFTWLGSGPLPVKNLKAFVVTGSLLIFAITLFTNQVFHGGVWGTLHNKSVRPKLEISNLQLNNSALQFQLYRTEGADVYGSFLIGMEVQDEAGTILKKLDGTALSQFPESSINNHYVANIKPGKHSLVIPLGAKADIVLNVSDIVFDPAKSYSLKLIDVSGLEWTATINR